MGRGGKLALRHCKKRRITSQSKGSDGSDEDYVVGEDEEDDESFDNSNYASFAGDASEETSDSGAMSGDGFSEELYEEEVENEEEEGRKMVRSKPRRGSSGQKRSMHKRFRKRTIVSSDDFDEDDEFMTDGTEEERKFVKSRHRSSSSRSRKSESKRLRKRSSRGACEDEEEETDDDYCDEEFIPDGIDFVDEEEMELSRSKPQKGSSGRSKTRLKRLGRRTKLSDDYNEDEDDCDDGDEEFRPDGIDYVDDEEELQVSKSKGGKRTTQKKVSVRSRKRKRKSKVSKKPMKKRRSKISRKRAISSDDDEFIVDSRSVQKSKKKPGKRKKTVVHSDSDFVSSGSSDYEYTISEEEREQVREANSFCGNLIKSRRNSSQADGDVSHQQRKTREGKGKEKVEDLHNDVGKQVCGICLTEEREETVRGILNCCSHYFCFSCIIEWSKVESRCPLCKQRFVTISKPARSTIGIDLRNVVIRVPKRDQVYRPSEEEVRGYYDPYANVVCMECQQGGDDNLMLLCDICDSPAHTYCVGLGREVPEGNWYCEGCRPANPGSSNLLVQDPESHQATSTNNLATGGSNSEGYAAATHISSPVADPSFSQGIEIPQSPRYPSGQGFPATSPMSGVGASTLSGRRWVHRHMHNILSSNRISQMTGIANRADAIAHSNLESAFVNFPVQQQSGQTNQNTRIVGNVPSYSTVMEGRRQDSSSCPEQGRTHLYATLNHLRRQVTQDPSTAIASASGMLCAELAGINVASGCEQLHSGGRPGFGFHDSISPGAHNVGNHLHEAKGTKEQLQSMVKSHLKCLSKGTQLGGKASASLPEFAETKISLGSVFLPWLYHSGSVQAQQVTHDHPPQEGCAFKDIARRSTHTILAACGLEHDRSVAIPVLQRPLHFCPHVEKVGESRNLMKDCCSSCINSLVRDVVTMVMNTRMQSAG